MRAHRAGSASPAPLAHRAGPAALALLTALSAAGCGGGGGAVPAAREAALPASPPSGSPSGTAAPLAGKTVVIDPGHNGGNAAHPKEINRQVDIITGRKACNTTGTETADGYPEHAFTWDVAGDLKPILERMGAKVVLTRPNDKGVGPCVTERAAIGNEARADAVLSIHGDGAAPSGHGFHVIMPGLLRGHNDDVVKPSAKLGRDIRDAYRAGTGMPYATYTAKNGLATRTDLGGLNLSTRPAVFIECGNMRNKGDAAKMSDAAFRKRMAAALADGIRRYLG
ncbi:cell wall hydrolase/autolysin [[Actinomadura] parvosata subsp. kistnae]|uniref:N-acetylmuramoyl-L-alanine amidase n=1 Tax=[Actinomadura] parvosata TaxID=1955412 RepID=UPI0009AD157C|nr:N-acetylmuramoyl-L-alanine amidase [Nonomuraea sp. ATCC 55076]SPL93446.1 cell wall hydrolase/autolysin [Actinomadura parvosata subsp. kistnae]